jgi:hypothetical protein
MEPRDDRLVVLGGERRAPNGAAGGPAHDEVADRGVAG